MRATRIALMGLLVATACSGITARETTLMPAMSLLWHSALAEDVELGIAEAVAGGAISALDGDRWRAQAALVGPALDSGDRFAVVPIDWASLRRFALDSIQARVDRGELGPGVGASFRETVNVFDQNWQILVSRERP